MRRETIKSSLRPAKSKDFLRSHETVSLMRARIRALKENFQGFFCVIFTEDPHSGSILNPKVFKNAASNFFEKSLFCQASWTEISIFLKVPSKCDSSVDEGLFCQPVEEMYQPFSPDRKPPRRPRNQAGSKRLKTSRQKSQETFIRGGHGCTQSHSFSPEWARLKRKYTSPKGYNFSNSAWTRSLLRKRAWNMTRLEAIFFRFLVTSEKTKISSKELFEDTFLRKNNWKRSTYGRTNHHWKSLWKTKKRFFQKATQPHTSLIVL